MSFMVRQSSYLHRLLIVIEITNVSLCTLPSVRQATREGLRQKSGKLGAHDLLFKVALVL